jgi:DNA-binding Xre family transcriptional regulator
MTVYSGKNKSSMSKFATQGRLTVLIGRQQAHSGERLTLRRLAQVANVSRDFVYQLNAGEARHVDLEALARLCRALDCRLDEILVWEQDGREPF